MGDVSTYSFDSHSKTSQTRVLDVESGHSTLLYEEASYSDVTWISDREIFLLRTGSPLSPGHFKSTTDGKNDDRVTEIRHFEGSLSSLKAKRLSDDEIAIAVCILTTPEGSMYNPAAEKKQHTTGKIYSSLFVRHWDTWVAENHNSIWYGLLRKDDKAYKLEHPGLVNALEGSKLQSPVSPFGGAGDFDIGKNGIVFVARDPEISPAIYTKTDLYFVPLKAFTETKPPMPQLVKTSKLRGYSAAPVFSRDGKKVAFTRMKSDQYETDKPRLMLVPNVFDLASVREFYQTDDGAGGWDARPEWITWSKDDSELYVSAEEHGRAKLWKLPSSPHEAIDFPAAVYEEGSVIEAKLLGDDGDKLLISTSSLVENSAYLVLDPASKKTDLVSSSSKHGKSFGLSSSQCDEFWFKGAEGYDVHALVVKPSDFDEKKKYPLAFLIHGGPQAAWMDSWSTRWNPAIFAEQGYIAVMPNPTGSTGYGQQHTDNIQNEWGGRPYVDLVKCFDHIEKHIPYIDSGNSVALGASYGGYMINWIQGHELGRKFKALVCHDGVFSTLNQWSTEELFFPLHDFGGPLWENREGYEKWDPAHHLDQWSTPQLVIHNELDYRLPISEGLAMFNVLQARGVPSKLLMFPDENHILRTTGFHASRPVVLDTLTELAARYMYALCQATARHAADNNPEGETPGIVDVRMALQELGAVPPDDVLADSRGAILGEIMDSIERGVGGGEAAAAGDEPDGEEDLATTTALAEVARERERVEDTRGVEEFAKWFSGPRNKSIREAAVGDGEPEMGDYLNVLKKKHSKTGEDSKYHGTIIGKGNDVGEVQVEGGDLPSIHTWRTKMQGPLSDSAPSATSPRIKEESRPPSSGLSSVGDRLGDDRDGMDLS
ncbi:Dipeptidyl-peptidase 5 [Colletotrichum tanaceti]|nr:Dipeptidyl-peptidase 5 [Colletotrichum tanaceti]